MSSAPVGGKRHCHLEISLFILDASCGGPSLRKKTASLWRHEEEEDEKEDDLLEEKQEVEEPEKKGEACSDARNNADGVAKESKKLAATTSAKKIQRLTCRSWSPMIMPMKQLWVLP